jgi:uncharacterized protein
VSARAAAGRTRAPPGSWRCRLLAPWLLAPWLLAPWLLGLAASLAFAADVPYLTGRVVDDAELLSPAARSALEAKLAALESRTGDQVVVLTVHSTGGESIDGYANAVFQAWALGQKGKDNGVLIVVVPDERRMRFEVGYGLEGSLTDSKAGRIVGDVMTPRFKAGEFERGIGAGVDAVLAVIEGGEVPATAASPPPARHFTFGDDLELPPWPMRILLGAFIFGIIGLFTVLGVLTPGAGWFLYIFLIPFWAMFPIMVVGVRGALILLGTYVVGFPLVKLWASSRPWYARARDDLEHNRSATIGGWTLSPGGAGGSWSSGSSGGSSGGFSGGGGSSGGGGASGSW